MAFTLESISSTKKQQAPKMIVFGANKIGKTTFAASAPKSIGILTEDGAGAVESQAFPLCRSLNDVYSAIGTLINEKHEFETLFFDSLDWFEPMLHQHVCETNRWSTIESAGYGKGYIAAAEQWRHMLAGLETLRNQKNMTIILLAHDKIKRLESPMHENYDTYTLKLHDRACGILLEWADIVGYCAHKIITRSQESGFGQKETKALTTGERVLHLEPHPAHCAGNRLGLKDVPLSWDAFYNQLTLNR
jgi:hypothetical protein